MSCNSTASKISQLERERAKRIRIGMESDPRDSRHGTEYAQYGCSCSHCAAWRAKHERAVRKGNKTASALRAERTKAQVNAVKPLWSHRAELDETKLETKQPLFSVGSKAKRHSSYCS